MQTLVVEVVVTVEMVVVEEVEEEVVCWSQCEKMDASSICDNTGWFRLWEYKLVELPKE